MPSCKKNLAFLVMLTLLLSCAKEILTQGEVEAISSINTSNKIKIRIDSAYTYAGDSLYKSMAREYYATRTDDTSKTVARMSQSSKANINPEDQAFFSKKHTVRTTEPILYHNRVNIYPGAIIDGGTIARANYLPIFVPNRNPISVAMSVVHSPPRSTIRTIENPSSNTLRDYVAEMAYDANFDQNEKFMFQYRRFSFYDELKQAFGSDIDTRSLFSSRSESNSSESHKILKSSGLYVKFFQGSFTVNVDSSPLADDPIQTTTGERPVYVKSVTYGRMGMIVIETDEDYHFAESCIKKEFDRIFYNKTEELSQEELRFFEQTDFKVLIMGADSDYTVQTFKGYAHFLNLIYNSTFSGTSFGVPIACTFADANTHQVIETEFENVTYIDPLYVHVTREIISQHSDPSGQNDYMNSQVYLNFYSDRERTKSANPYHDIVFEYTEIENDCNQTVEYQNGMPMIKQDCRDRNESYKIRNQAISNRLLLGSQTSSFQSTGPLPMPGEPQVSWSANDYRKNVFLQESPFFIILH